MSKKDKISELTTHVDRASKLLFKEYHDLLLELAFPGQEVSVVNIEENVEINLPTRPVDYVEKIQSFRQSQLLGAREKSSKKEHYTSNSILPISQASHKRCSSTLVS